jgi:N utilization substance protein A
VQSIVRELGGERIDIVPWSADASVFVSRALAPARVMDVKVQEAERRMLVIVADDQLSLAIGKGGQNARLAARLTGWKIDLVSKTDEKKRVDLERASRIEVEKLGLGEATTEKLISAGIETVQELLATPLEKLVEIPGIGGKTAEKVLATAQDYIAAHPPVAPSVPGELEFTPEMEPAPDNNLAAADAGPSATSETAEGADSAE